MPNKDTTLMNLSETELEQLFKDIATRAFANRTDDFEKCIKFCEETTTNFVYLLMALNNTAEMSCFNSCIEIITNKVKQAMNMVDDCGE